MYSMHTKTYSGNPNICICKDGKYLTSTAHTLVNVCNKTDDNDTDDKDHVSANVINTIPTNMANTISSNVSGTTSANSDCKKIRYKVSCYISHTVLLLILLLFLVTIISYHYAKH